MIDKPASAQIHVERATQSGIGHGTPGKNWNWERTEGEKRLNHVVAPNFDASLFLPNFCDLGAYTPQISALQWVRSRKFFAEFAKDRIFLRRAVNLSTTPRIAILRVAAVASLLSAVTWRLLADQ